MGASGSAISCFFVGKIFETVVVTASIFSLVACAIIIFIAYNDTPNSRTPDVTNDQAELLSIEHEIE